MDFLQINVRTADPHWVGPPGVDAMSKSILEFLLLVRANAWPEFGRASLQLPWDGRQRITGKHCGHPRTLRLTLSRHEAPFTCFKETAFTVNGLRCLRYSQGAILPAEHL